MGGKSKPKMDVTEYYMSIHYGICHGPVDAFLEMFSEEKQFWSGSVTEPQMLNISKENLFGGIKKEGGLRGHAHMLPGAINQVLPSAFASRLGLTPETAPGFRGCASVAFLGPGGRQPGFYWRANSPYLPGTWIKVRRSPKGMTPGQSMLGPNANPVHIIFEAMTNTDWGMGAPVDSFDMDSFDTAAATLIDEGFGLSLGWFAQGEIQTFITEIIDHIEAALYVSPETGLFTIKLIRDDYDPATLDIITPDNAQLDNFQRKLWAETVNEIVVTWTNPENEEEETVSIQDLANIAMQGGIVSDSKNYYGVRNADLAMRLAARDCRVASSPMASCDAIVNRKMFRVAPGGVIKLTWPEWGVNEAVMRIGTVSYGRPGDPHVKISLVEDIFSATTAAFVSPPTSLWVDTSENPAPLAYSLVQTMPYYFLANLVDPGDVADFQFPTVLSMVLGAQNGQDTNQFELFGTLTDPNGDPLQTNLGTLDIVSRAVTSVILPFQATTTNVTFTNLTRGDGPVVGGFVVIGSGSDEECELALITDASTNTITLRRGLLDTIPREWPSGTPLWFVNSDLTFWDSSNWAAGEEVTYLPCPWTSRGMLEVNEADEISGTLSARPWLPYRPANVRINDEPFGEFDLDVTPTLEVTWAHRNRTFEDSVVMAWDAGNTSPEPGQTTTIRFEDTEGVAYNEISGLTGTSHTLNQVPFLNRDETILRILSVRDGLESLQSHTFKILNSGGFSPPAPHLLKYWFAADIGVFSDEGSTAAVNNDPVRLWSNLASEEDAEQSTFANRPIFKTGGLNGLPYIECVHANAQFFEDIVGVEQPSGLSNVRPYTIVIVTDAITDLNLLPSVFGSPATNGGKNGFYFREEVDQQVHVSKNNFRFGNVANPMILFVGNRRSSNPETAETYTNANALLHNRMNGSSGIVSSSTNAITTAITQTQFLRNTGLSTDGYFNGRIYEVFLYDGVLPRAQWGVIEDYLMSKYGFTYTPGSFT